MYQTIRKTVSLLLAVVLILACGVMAVVAAPKTAESKLGCDHTWSEISSDEIKGRAVYVSNFGCRRFVLVKRYCPKCLEEGSYNYYTTEKRHSGYIKSATCDGTTQIHTYLCDYCNHNYTKTVTCRGNHGPSCPYLPI